MNAMILSWEGKKNEGSRNWIIKTQNSQKTGLQRPRTLKKLDYKNPELCSLSSINIPTQSANQFPSEQIFLRSGKRERRQEQHLSQCRSPKRTKQETQDEIKPNPNKSDRKELGLEQWEAEAGGAQGLEAGGLKKPTLRQ